MNSSERIKKVLKGEIPDRIPICEVCFWPKTIERWKKEGLPESVDIYDFFGMDRITFLYYKYGFYLERKTLEETEECLIYRDEYGNILKDWKPESPNFGVPFYISHSLKNKYDWEKMKERLNVSEERIPDNFFEYYKSARKKGDFIALTIEEPAWFIIQRTFGFENGDYHY